MQVIEYRRFIRHPISMPLSYKVIKKSSKEEQAKERSETINVSLGGLLFSGKRPVESGSIVMIKMPFESRVFNIRAKVVRCGKNVETKIYDIAVSFLRTQEAFKAKMIEQIYLIAEYRNLLELQTGKDVSIEEASHKWIKRYSARFSRLHW